MKRGKKKGESEQNETGNEEEKGANDEKHVKGERRKC